LNRVGFQFTSNKLAAISTQAGLVLSIRFAISLKDVRYVRVLVTGMPIEPILMFEGKAGCILLNICIS